MGSRGIWETLRSVRVERSVSAGPKCTWISPPVFLAQTAPASPVSQAWSSLRDSNVLVPPLRMSYTQVSTQVVLWFPHLSLCLNVSLSDIYLPMQHKSSPISHCAVQSPHLLSYAVDSPCHHQTSRGYLYIGCPQNGSSRRIEMILFTSSQAQRIMDGT